MMELGFKPRQHGSTLNGKKRDRQALEAEISSLQQSGREEPSKVFWGTESGWGWGRLALQLRNQRQGISGLV